MAPRPRNGGPADLNYGRGECGAVPAQDMSALLEQRIADGLAGATAIGAGPQCLGPANNVPVRIPDVLEACCQWDEQTRLAGPGSRGKITIGWEGT